jgi:hypothetical protein
METRLTLRPGQNGTKKLVERYGERLIRVRYLYDPQTQRRLKTVELVVESVPWRPRMRHPRRRDDEIVAVRIAFSESDLRERAKRLGAVWRPAQKQNYGRSAGAMPNASASPTACQDRTPSKANTPRYMPAYFSIYRWMVASTNRCF